VDLDEIVSESVQQISINGESHAVPTDISIDGLLVYLAIDRRHVAVEQNRKLIVKADYGETMVKDGDVFELVTFVGGG
jgi:sulfur carrier protein